MYEQDYTEHALKGFGVMEGSSHMYKSTGTTRRRKLLPLYGIPRLPADGSSQPSSIIDAFPVPSWESDDSGRFIIVNRAWQTFAGLSSGELVGEGWNAGIQEEDRSRVNASFQESFHARTTFDMEFRICRHDGISRWVRAFGEPIPDGGSPIAGYRGTLLDVTGHRQQDETYATTICEKETLLKELHHRVKNNMQIISSMLHLQESSVKDPFDQALFQESQNRIRTMALIHEQIYRSKNLAAVDFGEYLQRLAFTMKSAYMAEDDRCTLDFCVENISVDINKAIPAGLLVHEMLSNAFKHAFPAGRSGVVRIAFASDPTGMCLLSVSDNGIGFPGTIDVTTGETLGFRLITLLADQLEGALEVDRTNGSTFTVRFQR
jgi:PAS domain S-box-containing protein